jgi:iron(III) transport system substrate-binding protein
MARFHISKFGVEYLEQLGELKPRIFDTTSVLMEALTRGEISVGTSSASAAYAVQSSGAPIRLAVPEDGVNGTPFAMGLTPQGEKSAAAKVFMNWTMSKAGQAFTAAQGYVPGRTGLPAQATGDYQLPAADSPDFVIHTLADEKHAKSDTKVWNNAMGYLG